MNISVCITVFNEEGSVGALLDSLLAQSKKADQIIFVDGGSTDKTVEIIRHYQRKDGRIKLLVEKCSRARGRNLAVEIAKGEVIAMTDAGCIAHKDWLEEITGPFANKEVDISAGFYEMKGQNPMQKAMSVFLGVMPRSFGMNFLPSTRSIAFRKRVWEEIGGFPDEERNSAEDTYFNYSALKLGMKYARVKSAVVEWGMPETAAQFMSKIQEYAKWDARTKIWIFPKKGLASHNIHSLFIIGRYLLFLLLIVISLYYRLSLLYCFIAALPYFLWAFRKVYLALGDYKAALWGVVLQIVSDIGVIKGFVEGLLER